MTTVCPKCESKRWMNGLSLHTRADVGIVAVKGPRRADTDVKVNVCGDCGYIEFMATEPQKLWEEWRRHNA